MFYVCKNVYSQRLIYDAVRKPTIWVPTRSDTDLSVQSLKMVTGFNFNMRVEKTKALISFAVTAKLICFLFSPMHIVGFLMRRLIYHSIAGQNGRCFQSLRQKSKVRLL